MTCYWYYNCKCKKMIFKSLLLKSKYQFCMFCNEFFITYSEQKPRVKYLQIQQVFGRRIDYSWKILEIHKLIKNYEQVLAEFFRDTKAKKGKLIFSKTRLWALLVKFFCKYLYLTLLILEHCIFISPVWNKEKTFDLSINK